MKTLIKYLAAMAVAVALPTIANALTIGDDHELGFVEFGIPSGDANRTTYVNHLINMALGTSDSADGQTYFRSNNFFGSLPAAVFALNGTGTSIDLGNGYQYLFAKYDGPNFGSEVWFVGDLSGTITIPAGAGGESGDKYGLSGWTLFNPGEGNGNGVPEGGATLAMLGIAMVGIGMLKRKLGAS